MTASREDIAWAAGLFEGEGSIVSRRGRDLRVSMTDADVVMRFAGVLGLRTYGPYQPTRAGSKEVFVAATSNFERAQAAVAMMWPWLGERRKRLVQEALRVHAQ